MPEFAGRMAQMAKSAAIIRNLFGAMNDPGIISFGGGAPAKEALPVELVREIVNDVMTREKRGIESLQYGPVPGLADLREVVVEHLLTPKGVSANPDEVVITTGGLEGMNLLCQLYIEPGDVILVESPTFVQSVEIFEMFQARCVSVAMDDDGMVTDDLEAKILKYRPKMVYVIPTFQNPTGRTLSLERRKKIAQLGSEHDVIILEDDPYRDIRYSGTDLPPIKSFDETGHTVLANSFSKIFSPGSRLGYVLAKPEITAKIIDAKSATNSHTSMLPQVVCAEFFKRGHYPEHHRAMCELYRHRRDVMIECIDKFFPEGTKRTFPDGGLFTWAEIPGGINTTDLLVEATSNPDVKVAYVAGEGFFIEGNGMGSDCMRISFGGVTEDNIRLGTERLGKLIGSKL
ncbi:aminotransferase-like domain-containing protein [Dethiosulfovibrio salsuginis]|uniref:2-aminoadipate transaminase n=1 Tax=Dethiosulfovibrio salsuginis TaxID=561720 RepID=A0A1X7IHI5_9BACT|nr:PLP-dependent aminotransferase family protein [Dethiosulfovibrio salsuginis]SMG14119.1 2-aminoadipate transaminase [Dethiosulfovibrio salsuginis]